MVKQEQKLNVLTERVLIADIVLLEKNARFMKQETFNRLKENIQLDGTLTSYPLLWWDKARDKWECLSGNHRVMAARDIGLTEITAIVCRDDLPKDRRRAIQLAHNSITGQDDPQLLAEIYREIDSLDMRAYTGEDDAILQILTESPKIENLSDVTIEYRDIRFVFLPEEVDQVRVILKEMPSLLDEEPIVAHMKQYDPFMDMLQEISQNANVKSYAVPIMLLLAMFGRHRTEFASEWFDNAEQLTNNHQWIPLATLLGRTAVPPKVALIIKKALDKMVAAGDITPNALWRGIELLCADYLAGAGE